MNSSSTADFLERSHEPEPDTIECATLAAANEIRRRWSDLVDDTDDARMKTVRVNADALDHWVDAMGDIARRSWDEREERHGQLRLTRGELNRINWTETNVPHAQACKAIAADYGVDDWVAHYDGALTVDEHLDVYRGARAGATGPTLRMQPTNTGMGVCVR